MAGQIGIEKRIILAASVFAVSLAGVIALTVKMYGIDLPDCLTDVRPFREAKVIQHAPKRYEIHYVARMWKFDPPEVSIVPGSTADIYLATADVTHGMQIVGTNLNLMAVPGAVNYARVKFDKPGDYLIVCNEYCGVAHQAMAGRIHVTDKAAALPEAEKAEVVPAGGRELLDKYACLACHSLDGSPMPGPTFKGMYGTTITLADGKTVKVDDAYLAESIERPDAKIVKGFENVMPPSGATPAEVHAMVEYLEKVH